MNIRPRAVCVSALMTPALPVVTPQTTVGPALRLLRELRLLARPVCTGDRFVGLVGERDLLRFTPSEATTLDVYELREVVEKLTVARAVRAAPALLSPETPVEDAAVRMLSTGAEVLPVMTGGRLAGFLHWTAVLGSTLAPRPS